MHGSSRTFLSLRLGLAAIALFVWLSAPSGASAQPSAESEPKERPTLSLEKLIEEALEANPEIQAVRHRLEAARQEIPQARSLEDPQLSITQWAIPSDFSIADADETWYGISQSFPFPGKLRLRGQIADRAADAAEQEHLAKVREVVAAVKAAYYRLFLAHKTIEIYLEHQDLLEEFIRIADQKYALGQVSQQDLLKAQVELSKLHNSLIELEQEKVSVQAEINTILNRPPDVSLGRPEEPTYRTFPLALEELQRRAQETRPELKATAHTIEKSEKAVSLAKRNYLPDFMVEVMYWDVHEGPNKWQTMGRINFPWIFKAKYDARVQQAAAERAQARADHQAVLNHTLFELRDLFVKIKTNEQLIEVYRRGVLPQAEQSLEAARIGYQAGRVDFLDLIDSERTLRDFQLEYYAVLARFEQNVAELERAVGEELRF